MGLVCVFWGKGGQWSQELCDSSKWSCHVAAAGQHLPSERRFLPLLGPGPTAPAKGGTGQGTVNSWASHALRLTSILS